MKTNWKNYFCLRARQQFLLSFFSPPQSFFLHSLFNFFVVCMCCAQAFNGLANVWEVHVMNVIHFDEADEITNNGFLFQSLTVVVCSLHLRIFCAVCWSLFKWKDRAHLATTTSCILSLFVYTNSGGLKWWNERAEVKQNKKFCIWIECLIMALRHLIPFVDFSWTSAGLKWRKEKLILVHNTCSLVAPLWWECAI